MKNPSLAVLVFVPILIFSIGMYTYTSSQSVITDSINSMNTQEIEAFNSQFTLYGGSQTGAKLKSLLGILIANANTYNKEPDKIPEVQIEMIELNGNSEEEQESYIVNVAAPEKNNNESVQEYINKISEIRNSLENKHSYNVSFEYTTKGLLDKITIER